MIAKICPKHWFSYFIRAKISFSQNAEIAISVCPDFKTLWGSIKSPRLGLFGFSVLNNLFLGYPKNKFVQACSLMIYYISFLKKKFGRRIAIMIKFSSFEEVIRHSTISHLNIMFCFGVAITRFSNQMLWWPSWKSDGCHFHLDITRKIYIRKFYDNISNVFWGVLWFSK